MHIDLFTGAQPGLTREDGLNVVVAVSSMTASLWPTSHPPPAVAQLYRENPRMGHAVANFAPGLEHLSRTFLRGLAVS